MSYRPTTQIVQVGKQAENPPTRVTAQIVQVAIGFLKRAITVQVQSYPKSNPISFFSRRGEKSFVVGHNRVRVTDQIVQVARLRVPN